MHHLGPRFERAAVAGDRAQEIHLDVHRGHPFALGEGRLRREGEREIREQHDESALRPPERRGEPAAQRHRAGGRAERRLGRHDAEEVMQRRQRQFAANLCVDDLDPAARQELALVDAFARHRTEVRVRSVVHRGGLVRRSRWRRRCRPATERRQRVRGRCACATSYTRPAGRPRRPPRPPRGPSCARCGARAPLAAITDPMRAGRTYVIDISAVVYCVCAGSSDCSAHPRAASAASASTPPGTPPCDHSNHRDIGRLNAAVPASAPSNVSPVSRPIGGCARTRRNASRPLSSRADASRISPRTGMSRHSAGSRISTVRA